MALNVIIFSYFFPAVLSGKFFCVWGKYHVYLLPTNGKEMKTTGYTFSLFFFFSQALIAATYLLSIL